MPSNQGTDLRDQGRVVITNHEAWRELISFESITDFSQAQKTTDMRLKENNKVSYDSVV